MNRKTFIILLAAAAVLVVLAVIGQRPTGTGSIAGDSAGTLLLPALTDDLESIGEILIDGAGDQRLVSLDHSDEGWIVAELDGYQADQSAVNSLLIALSEARIAEEKTANPEFHSRLGVESIDGADATGIEVTLVAADGDRYAVVLGDTYSGGQRYARIADDDLSVLIDVNPEAGREPSEWVETEIIDIASGRVQRVEISHDDGEHLTIRKMTRDDTNFSVDAIPDGRELQYAGVANATGNLLQGLRLDEVRRRSDEPAETFAVTEFWTFDGLVVSVTVATDTNDASWLGFSARFDTGQALEFADTSVSGSIVGDQPADDGAAGNADAEADSTAAADTDAPTADADAMAEAEAINARLADWQFRVPSYQLSQLTRRMNDLLRAESAE